MMKQIISPIVLGLVLVCVSHGLAAEKAPKTAPEMNVIASWGDLTLVYGPGTDPSMDTDQAMENAFTHWKGRGFTGIYLRTDLAQAPAGAIVRHPGATQTNPVLSLAWHLIDELMEKTDPHAAATRAGRKVGFDHWMFHPYIYSEGAPADVGVPGLGRMVPWSYVRRYHAEHPEVITVDRQGNKLWMAPEYAYPGARADKVAEFVHMAKTYRPTGILASMRSEVNQLIDPPDHGDQYGFNQPVVDEMKRLYDVDIMTDPRFDYKSPSFKSDDPMVENWRNLRGGYLTQLYREIRQAMREVDPKIQLGITLSGEYIGPPLGNWRLQWRKWIDEGLLDVIVMPVFFEATLDLESEHKHYLTHARFGKGMVTVPEVKAYIAKSKHPDIRVIHAGAPSYFYPPPPDGADGWQCDVWYDAYTQAWYQRWEQWNKDIAELGHIKFFEQNFDAFPVRNAGIGGAWGDFRHNPDLRACPGVWRELGDGSDTKAIVQSETRRGNTGNAVLLTNQEFIAGHWSSPDRGRHTGALDTAIANGTAGFEFWLYRDNDKSSITALFTGDISNEKDVGLRIEPKTGQISYASGKEWIRTDHVLPLQQWQKFVIEVNVDELTYAAHGGNEKISICKDVKFAAAQERLIEEIGVHIPIKAPSYRIFNVLYFIPGTKKDNRVFLDDVLVKWTPTDHYAKRGAKIALQETFERYQAGALTATNKAEHGRWRVDGRDQANAFVMAKTTSFGPGVMSLRASGGGAMVGEPAQPLSTAGDGLITIDLDVFIRSNKDFPYIIPDPATRSAHSTVISLESASSDKPLIAVDSARGIWRLWDGTEYVDSKTLVTYDVWNHLQIALDPKKQTYRFVVQPVGELPTFVGQSAHGKTEKPRENLVLKISPSKSENHLSCYDNVLVTFE